MFLTHSDEALEIEKFKRSRENKIEFAYDYGNLNASYVNEKINFEDDYFQEIINPDFEKIDSPFQQTSSLKPCVLNVIFKKIIINLEDEVVNLLEKDKANLETIESLKSKSFESSEKVSSESENQSENDCLVVEKECDKEENPKTRCMGLESIVLLIAIDIKDTGMQGEDKGLEARRAAEKAYDVAKVDERVNKAVATANRSANAAKVVAVKAVQKQRPNKSNGGPHPWAIENFALVAKYPFGQILAQLFIFSTTSYSCPAAHISTSHSTSTHICGQGSASNIDKSLIEPSHDVDSQLSTMGLTPTINDNDLLGCTHTHVYVDDKATSPVTEGFNVCLPNLEHNYITTSDFTETVSNSSDNMHSALANCCSTPPCCNTYHLILSMFVTCYSISFKKMSAKIAQEQASESGSCSYSPPPVTVVLLRISGSASNIDKSLIEPSHDVDSQLSTMGLTPTINDNDLLGCTHTHVYVDDKATSPVTEGFNVCLPNLEHNYITTSDFTETVSNSSDNMHSALANCCKFSQMFCIIYVTDVSLVTTSALHNPEDVCYCRFVVAVCFCILSDTVHCILSSLAFCLGKTLLISKLGCILCQDVVAFCLEDVLRFISRSLRFVSRPSCVLPQDLLRFVSGSLHFVSRPSCVLPQDLCTLLLGQRERVNILMSIHEGPYRMGTVRGTLAESTEGAPQFGLERPRVYSDLTPEEKDRYNVDIRAINILLQGLPKDINTLINHYTDAKDIWGNVKMLLEGSEFTKEDRESQLDDDFEHF
nr:phosphatidylinositol-4-phosphate 5-kinase 8 -like protein [Tanacetum cinerariifolium]